MYLHLNITLKQYEPSDFTCQSDALFLSDSAVTLDFGLRSLIFINMWDQKVQLKQNDNANNANMLV